LARSDESLLRLDAIGKTFPARRLRIGGGLPLIGAIVAELAAGAAGQGSGLAFRITEAGYRLNIPRMFAALVLISFSALLIYGALALISQLALRHWHDTAPARPT
jgi:NitT/TauT family transport system permease protein